MRFFYVGVYMNKEEWKQIPDYEGLYQASNFGRIKNKKGLIMKQNIGDNGYKRISLYKDKRYKLEYVHILVAKSFIPNPLNKSEVNHKDAIKTNNNVNNLEWVTRRENHFHAVAMGLKPICPTKGKYDTDNPCVKPIYQYDLNGNFIKKWDSRNQAAFYYNVTPNSISRCMNGVRKTCKGFIWRRNPLPSTSMK